MLKLSRLPDGEPEVFTTIQGEGVSAGVPSTFVRLSLCSLRCVWCDSAFTWDWERYDPRVEIVRLEVPEVTRRVLAGGTRTVVITGGEPLLQQEEVALLATELKGAGRRLEVETSGTVLPQPGLAAAASSDQPGEQGEHEAAGERDDRREAAVVDVGSVEVHQRRATSPSCSSSAA